MLATANSGARAQWVIDSLIQAERNFAAHAESHSVKEAFLAFADSSSWMFVEGKAIKAIDFWTKREKNKTLLKWRPAFAEISRLGDMGYTTGPWSYQEKPGDPVLARGNYSTVWYKDQNGEWKFLVDLGNDGSPEINDSTCRKDDNTDPGYYPSTLQEMLKAENRLISTTSHYNHNGETRMNWYREFFSKSSWTILNRNERKPAFDTDNYFGAIESIPAEIHYTILHSGISSSNDLGYVFGTTLINGTSENYLRIWRAERKGWKLALEVLRYQPPPANN